jgi:Zn-dependent protease
MLILLPLIASGVGGENLYELIEAIQRKPSDLVLAPLLVGSFISLGIFLSILFHELGHALIAQRRGAEVTDITVMLLGGITKIKQRDIHTATDALQIAIAGPIANVVFGIICLLIARVFNDSLDTVLIFSILGSANLFIAAFNLIPTYPLDGGRILEAILWGQLGRERAIEIGSSIGRFISVFLGVFGLMNGMFLLMIMAGFFYLGAVSQRNQILQKPASPKEIIANRTLQPVLAIAEDSPPDHVVEELKKRGYLLALVRSVKGRILGIVDLKTLEACSDTMLAHLPLEHVESVYLDDEKAFNQVANVGWLVVFDEYNVLLGATPSSR